MSFDYLGFAYAASVAVGGVIGYLKAGSVISLAAGLSCGSLAAFGAYQSSVDPRNVGLSLFVSLLLAGLMGSRFINTGKFMPAGLVMSMSILMSIRGAVRLYQQHW